MSRIVTVVQLTIKVNKMNKSTKLLSVFGAIACATVLSSNSFAATGDSSSSGSATTVTEVVRINGVDAISIAEFEPDAGVAAVIDDFCLFSNDNSNAYPTADIVATESTHAGAGSIDTATAPVAGLKFDLDIAAPKLTLAGEDGSEDKHVLDYIATVSTLGGAEETDTDCDTDNYRLTVDLNDTDAKEAMAGAYAATVTITVSVRD